uniref:Uncharacterized protein n=1 Tax=Pipistrellus kuhlii TaxID=59472 RepID=A0A7J7SUN2_PIPKU|nr:hypothetical protein mPipKuh1_009775 [Pipistrellus kuhlii]
MRSRLFSLNPQKVEVTNQFSENNPPIFSYTTVIYTTGTGHNLRTERLSIFSVTCEIITFWKKCYDFVGRACMAKGVAERLRKDRQKNESCFLVGWGFLRDSANSHQPSLYFIADATRQSKGVVKMFTAFSWVLILLHYKHLIRLCLPAASSTQARGPRVWTTGSR